MIYILGVIFLVSFIIVIIDVFPQFNTWQSRIKIGRFASPEIWQSKVLGISKKWLQDKPVVPLTDNTRLIIIDMLKGNYKRIAIQSWQEAALVLGLAEYSKKEDDEKIRKQIVDFVNGKTDSFGAWKVKPTESDQAILAYAFINTDFIDPLKFKPAFDETYQMILSLQGPDGTIAYKNHVKQFRFVDTIGFICPFLVQYGLKFNKPEAIDLAIKQITEFEKYGMMQQEKIPCHTYNVETKIPTGLFGWGRGFGWFLIGLADSYLALPSEHPQKIRLENLMRQVAKSVLKFQLQDGSFTWLIFDINSRKDSSTVATVAYFFSVTAEIPELRAECIAGKEKCLHYLQTITRRNGAIDFSQGDTKGVGVYSQNFNVLPFTQGFVLRTLNFKPQP